MSTTGSRTGVVFVHGFLSGPAVWDRFCRLLREDPELADQLDLHPFEYRTPLISLHPLRRVPGLEDVADSLRTLLSHDLARLDRLVLVSHSQGGLVIQRMLAQVLGDSDGAELDRIKLIVMYACPNAGSDLALSLRRWLPFNRQEKQLQPLQEAVTRAQAVVLDRIVHTGRIPVRVYAGDADRVVLPASARSVFPGAGTVPGDHSSVIQPDSRSHRSYVVLAHHLRAVLANPAPALAAPPPPPVPPQRRRPEAAALPPAEYARVVDGLLAVPGMTDPAVRAQMYARLPGPVRQQLAHSPVARLELIGLVQTLEEYRHLHGWDALAAALRLLAPDQPRVAEVLAVLAELGLLAAEPSH